MLSSVLKSEREALETNRELARKFSELETHVGQHDDDEIAAIVEAIRQLIIAPEKSQREIGFHVRETPPRYGRPARKRR